MLGDVVASNFADCHCHGGFRSLAHGVVADRFTLPRKLWLCTHARARCCPKLANCGDVGFICAFQRLWLISFILAPNSEVRSQKLHPISRTNHVGVLNLLTCSHAYFCARPAQPKNGS